MRLPQELVNKIVDEIDVELSTLRACALAARSFVHASQARIFRAIQLSDIMGDPLDGEKRSGGLLRRFFALLVTSPHIAHHVRTLQVRGDSNHGHLDYLSHILCSLHNLWCLTISSISSSGIPLSKPSWIPSSPLVPILFKAFALPSLRCIGFSGFRFRDAEELHSLLVHSPNLKELELSNVSIQNSAFCGPSESALRSPHRVSVEKLDLAFDLSSAKIKSIFDTFSTVDISHLKSLQLRHCSCAVLQTLFNASAPTIEEVVLCGLCASFRGQLSADVVYNPDIGADHFEDWSSESEDFKPVALAALRSIEIANSDIGDTVDALRHFGALRNLQSLRTLTVDISGMSRVDEAHWKALDGLFADSDGLLTKLTLRVEVRELDVELVTTMLPTISRAGRAVVRLSEYGAEDRYAVSSMSMCCDVGWPSLIFPAQFQSVPFRKASCLHCFSLGVL